MSEKMNELLKKLNEEDVASVTKQTMGITRSEDWEKVPEGMKRLFKGYKDAGGECDNIWDFMGDITGFLGSKNFSGRHIAEWDKKQGPESKEAETEEE